MQGVGDVGRKMQIFSEILGEWDKALLLGKINEAKQIQNKVKELSELILEVKDHDEAEKKRRISLISKASITNHCLNLIEHLKTSREVSKDKLKQIKDAITNPK